MVGIRQVIMGIILLVIMVSLTPTIWDAVHSSAVEKNTCGGGCYGSTANRNCSCANGTTSTLLQLVPVVFVGATILGGIVLAVRKR